MSINQSTDYNKPAVTRAKEAKYRPVLTASQIEKILFLAKTELPTLSKESMSLISTLSPFQAKIQNAGIAAAYTMSNKPRANSLEALGGLPKRDNLAILPQPGYETKELYWQACYELYVSDPAACSLEQIQGAKEHMYLEGLMSEQEVADFEQGEG